MTTTRRHPTRSTRDEGAILPMAVVLVLVFGVLAAAMASYGAVSFRHHRVVRLQTSLRASAEAGLRYGLESMRLHTNLCSDQAAVGTNLAVKIPITPNNATVAVTCRYVSGNLPGPNMWSVILTGNGTSASVPELISQSGGGTLKRLDGPVYLGVTSPASRVSDLKSPVRINEGDVFYYDATCAANVVAPTIANLSFAPSPPRGRLCATSTWQAVAPMPALPPKPLPIDPPGRDDLVAGCRIFFPGAYASPPALRKGDNYFISGEYYFEFDDTLEIKQADVQGGQPDPYSDDVPAFTNLAPSCADVLSNPDVAAAETGYGATFVLGGRSKIDIGVQARVEIFSRIQAGGQNVSVQAVESAGAGYNPSTLTVADGPILWMHPGSNNDMVVHGLIRVPNAQVAFGNVTNSVTAQATGGIVAASIDMQGSASANGWVIGRSTRPAATKVVLTSTASDTTGVKVTMQAVADYRLGRNVEDGATFTGSVLVVSNSARFTSADVGSTIIASSLPPGAKILQVIAPSIVFVSATATATRSALTVTIRTPEVAVNSWRRV